MSVAGIIPGSPDALEAQARIEHEIKELHQTICRLHAQIRILWTRRNTLSLVSRLPPEVLSAIFIHCAEIYHESAIEEMEGVPDWVNVSYVCRHWRDVALNCPALWSYVFVASQRWTEELLSRSKQGPLRICFKWANTNFKLTEILTLKQVLAQAERIQELTLEVPPNDAKTVLSMLSSPAPILRSLQIYVDRPFVHDKFDSATLFNGATPALRRLELLHCFVLPPASVLGSLTTLVLGHLDHTISPTIAELQVILYSMQNLVHLELIRVLAWHGNELDSRSADVPENPQPLRLLRFAIFEPVPIVVELLSRFDIPSRTEVRIQTYLEHSFRDPGKWAPLRSLLSKRFFTSKNYPPSYIRTLAVDVQRNALLAFGASNREYSSGWRSPDWDCGIPLKIELYGPGPPVVDKRDTVLDIIQDACLSGFLTGLQSARVTIEVEKIRYDCSTFLTEILCLVPQIRYIKVIKASTSLPSLCSFLSTTPHRRAHDRDEDISIRQSSALVFAPTLDELVIHRAKFDRPALRPGRNCDVVLNLYEALATRKDKGHPLKRLTLTECNNFFKEDMLGLESVVSEVSWDGIEDMEPLSPDSDESKSYIYSGDRSETEDSSENDEVNGESADEGEGEGDVEHAAPEE